MPYSFVIALSWAGKGFSPMKGYSGTHTTQSAWCASGMPITDTKRSAPAIAKMPP